MSEKTYAQQAHSQFGRYLIGMGGAKHGLLVNETTVQYKIGCNPKKVQFVELSYDIGLDLYHVRTFKVNRKTYEQKTLSQTAQPLYVDQVLPEIERATGLYMTL